MPVQFLADELLAPDQNDSHIHRPGGLQCAFYFRLGEMVAAHRIEGYRHHGIKDRPVSLGFDDFNDFAAFVLAAMRASAMGADLFVTIRTLGQLRYLQCIVRASRGGAALRMPPFGIWH